MEYSPPPLFNQGPSARVRLIFFVLLSLLLLVLDARSGALEVVRKFIGAGLYPLQQTATIPFRAASDLLDYFDQVDELQAENDSLRKQQLAMSRRLSTLRMLEVENEKLRKLTEIGKTLRVDRTFLSEVISDTADPFSRRVVLNKGTIHGVDAGMPVIDELGLIGQVTRSYASRSEVSLVTDKDQIIPVESLRNGIRSVAYGGLDGGLMELRFMSANADIENGDLLVTSGLDGVYPRGIPVAKVIRVEKNSRYAFASIFCEPIAGVDSNRFLLVLETNDPEPPPAEPAGEEVPTEAAAPTASNEKPSNSGNADVRSN